VRSSPPRGFLLDLDGTLYTDNAPVPGGPEALAELRRQGISFRAVTNTTTRSRSGLVERLGGFGYDISAAEIITPILAARDLCRANGHHRVALYLPDAAREDLSGLEVVDANIPADPPDAVIVGDLGEEWNFGLMQEAFTLLLGGAALIALSHDRYYLKQNRLTLDAGPFVAALEFAAGRNATVVGKPSREFYQTALSSLGLPAGEVAMVGDDLWSDIEGGQKAGLRGWLVRTGKFREEKLRESGVQPERILGSIADLTSYLSRPTVA
jgi:HAD superfamily hydrolase (TIGR01458 family)